MATMMCDLERNKALVTASSAPSPKRRKTAAKQDRRWQHRRKQPTALCLVQRIGGQLLPDPFPEHVVLKHPAAAGRAGRLDLRALPNVSHQSLPGGNPVPSDSQRAI
eukprot:scaffold363224_cov24-Prasinocladus_malaysianus.AAC.1